MNNNIYKYISRAYVWLPWQSYYISGNKNLWEEFLDMQFHIS